jgi:hypothetical protein
VNREAELETPSRVACSDLLGGQNLMAWPTVNMPGQSLRKSKRANQKESIADQV